MGGTGTEAKIKAHDLSGENLASAEDILEAGNEGSEEEQPQRPISAMAVMTVYEPSERDHPTAPPVTPIRGASLYRM